MDFKIQLEKKNFLIIFTKLFVHWNQIADKHKIIDIYFENKIKSSVIVSI